LLEIYIKTINIEAHTMLDMAKRQILPAVISFTRNIASSITSIQATGLSVDISAQTELLQEVSALLAQLKKSITALEQATSDATNFSGSSYEHAVMYRDIVITKMNELRLVADKLETIVDEEMWPFPTYSELLYNV
jgi:glutamine synthetase